MSDDEKLILEFTRITTSDNIIDIRYKYSLVMNVGFTILMDDNFISNAIIKDMQLLFQTIIVKCHSVLQLSYGFSYKNPHNKKELNEITDPLSLMSIVRSQFEAYSTFNNIALKHSNEEQYIIYLLWVISGLKVRQGYVISEIEEDELKYLSKKEIEDKKLTREWLKAKKEDERLQIEHFINEIKSTTIFKNLTEEEVEQYDFFITKRKWQVAFKNNKLITQDWQQLFLNSGVSAKAFYDTMYKYLSTLAHPTNVSVFQFANFYNDTAEHFGFTIHSLDISNYFICFLIRDYCMMIPDSKKIFDSMPVMDQMLINSVNKIFRGSEYQINDTYDKIIAKNDKLLLSEMMKIRN